MKLSNSFPSNKGFNLIKLMFGVGIGTLVLAGVATALVPDFLPWMTLMSAAVLAIPLGNYLVRKTAIADSQCRAQCKERFAERSAVGSTAGAGLHHECSTSVGHVLRADVRQTGHVKVSTY